MTIDNILKDYDLDTDRNYKKLEEIVNNLLMN